MAGDTVVLDIAFRVEVDREYSATQIKAALVSALARGPFILRAEHGITVQIPLALDVARPEFGEELDD